VPVLNKNLKITRMKKIEIILEKNDGLLWGRIDGKGWLPTPYGTTVNEVIESLKELQEDYVRHEGKNDNAWNNIIWSQVTFELKYDLAAFFEAFNYLNLSAVAGKIGINRTLLNHYKTGLKYPSAEQAKKIEDAIHVLALELGKVKLVA
jgi:hypothetical protein